MSRNADISNLNIEQTKCVVTHYDQSGDPIKDRKVKAASLDFNESPRTYAIKQESSYKGKEAEDYWIIVSRGQVVDPYGADTHMSILNSKNCSFHKVNKSCFDNYMSYLTTQHRSYYTRTRRTVTFK
jgi:hypothetical protein